MRSTTLRDCNAYCTAQDCDRATAEGRTLCWAHWKQMQRTGKTTPITEKLTPADRLELAGKRYWDSDTENDEEFQSNRRAFHQSARQFARVDTEAEVKRALEAQAERRKQALREGLTRARQRGAALGRPPRLDPREVRKAVKRHGSVLGAAKALGASRTAVRSALRRVS